MRNMLRPDARSIPMVVPYAGGILSGQGMLVGAFFGVAAMDAAQNTTVECETRGEFDLAKDPSQAITAGARLFWERGARQPVITPFARSEAISASV
jgi:predicted RecA/RadA family phage recombinase